MRIFSVLERSGRTSERNGLQKAFSGLEHLLNQSRTIRSASSEQSTRQKNFVFMTLPRSKRNFFYHSTSCVFFKMGGRGEGEAFIGMFSLTCLSRELRLR